MFSRALCADLNGEKATSFTTLWNLPTVSTLSSTCGGTRSQPGAALGAVAPPPPARPVPAAAANRSPPPRGRRTARTRRHVRTARAAAPERAPPSARARDARQAPIRARCDEGGPDPIRPAPAAPRPPGPLPPASHARRCDPGPMRADSAPQAPRSPSCRQRRPELRAPHRKPALSETRPARTQPIGGGTAPPANQSAQASSRRAPAANERATDADPPTFTLSANQRRALQLPPASSRSQPMGTAAALSPRSTRFAVRTCPPAPLPAVPHVAGAPAPPAPQQPSPPAPQPRCGRKKAWSRVAARGFIGREGNGGVSPPGGTRDAPGGSYTTKCRWSWSSSSGVSSTRCSRPCPGAHGMDTRPKRVRPCSFSRCACGRERRRWGRGGPSSNEPHEAPLNSPSGRTRRGTRRSWWGRRRPAAPAPSPAWPRPAQSRCFQHRPQPPLPPSPTRALPALLTRSASMLPFTAHSRAVCSNSRAAALRPAEMWGERVVTKPCPQRGGWGPWGSWGG